MTKDAKAELLGALSDTALELQTAAARLLDPLSDSEWEQTLDRLTELRRVRQDLERKLAALNSACALIRHQ